MAAFGILNQENDTNFCYSIMSSELCVMRYDFWTVKSRVHNLKVVTHIISENNNM